MAYRTFTSKKISEILGLKREIVDLFKGQTIESLQASQRLRLVLESSLLMTISTEKAVCEYLVSPILTEIKLANHGKIDLFSGEQLNADKSKNLNGEVDFMFAKVPNFSVVEAPVFCITEAKIGMIDKAIPQAAAQMFGARLFNEKEGKPIKVIYGAVTDGKTWRFLKLEEQILYTDFNIIYLDNLPLLLGTLQWIINFYIKKNDK